MNAPTLPHDSEDLAVACDAIGVWQKALSDHKYNDGNWTADRWQRHTDLLKAAREQAHKSLAETIISQVASAAASTFSKEPETALKTAINQLPILTTPVKRHELANLTWQTARTMHTAFTAAGVTRSHVSEYGWWHLVTLRLLRDGSSFDKSSPVIYLTHSGLGASGEVPDHILNGTSHQDVTAEERKKVDAAIRNLFRHCGGIYHRRKHWLVDSPLARAWWSVEIATTASGHTCSNRLDLTDQDIHDAISHSWRVWASKAVNQAPRLAMPQMVCVYVLIQRQRPDLTDADIIELLMRRTQHLAVQKLAPADIASLV